ncbi:MAG: Fe2+-dependent dioxygenase [Henriciella sp.]|uniref:Fe2+-dependent dioxygenase n=1 Tax=Henriciella sp. TaxID=1968823 RepID=UPI0032EFDFEA
MLITIPGLLGPQALSEIRSTLDTVGWRDGRITAGAQAARVKNNQQADLSTRSGVALHKRLHDAITGNAIFEAAAQPKKLSRLMVSKAGEGEGYGTHVDNVLMRSGEDRLRTDLSFTLFLSQPSDYDGGELTIDWAGMVHSMKLEAGSLLLYPSTSLHQVETVTRGERIVCVGWVESLVRTAEQREILFDLENLRATLGQSLPHEAPEQLALAKIAANIRRLWVEN